MKDGGVILDIKKMIVLTYVSFNRFNKIWCVRNISGRIKVMFFKILVFLVFFYGCETWKMIKGEEKKFDIF